MPIKNNFIVSIIMNCHNGEKYLYESVESVLKQTFSNWELIFFDNCSNDNSLSIIDSFQDKRIKIFKSNIFLKLYQARNEAIKKITGKYVHFLDTDDIWRKDKVEKQVKFLEKNKNYSMVYSNFYIFNQKNYTSNIFYKSKLPEGMITKKILKKYSIGLLTTCIKTEVFKTNRFNENFDIIGDFDFFINLSINSKIGCIQEPLAYYRMHNENYSKKNIKIYIEELKYWINSNKLKVESLGYSIFQQKLFLLKLRIKFFLNILGM